MRTSKGLSLARELVGENKNAKMLALEMADLLEMRDNGYTLTEKDKFILGLGYSEFFAIGNSDDAYLRAEAKKSEYLKVLEIDGMVLYKEIEASYGRHITA